MCNIQDFKREAEAFRPLIKPVLETLNQRPMRAEDIAFFVGAEPSRIHAVLMYLRLEGDVVRVPAAYTDVDVEWAISSPHRLVA